MFGYIRIHEQELRVREVSLYRSYYCGLCEDLFETYGRAGQLTLSYDTTFLGFLLSCLYEPSDERRTQTVCLTHPFQKHPMRRSRYTQYAADMTILLAFYSGRDNWQDERRIRGLALSGILHGAFKKASARHPEKAAAIKDCLDRLHEIENRTGSFGDSSPADQAGSCFGALMAELFVYEKDIWEESLRRMGFFLGKYIYLLDAYDDLDRDASSGSFNPLLPVLARMEERGEDFDGYVRDLLTMCMASCCRAFEALPILENVDILRNILYAGVWIRFEQIRASRTGCAACADENTLNQDENTPNQDEDLSGQD